MTTTENSRADALTDGQLCAVQYATEALRAIAERREQVDDVIRPLNDIRAASRRAAAALKRFEPVANALLAESPAEQPAAAPIPEDCDVRNILLAVVPGKDGEGQEVYARNVADVERLLSEMGEKLDAVDAAKQPAPSPADERDKG
ncbi:hypothetical protein [Burkholderia cenocepacia]|uniref:hypothetical protein n=1 Tax=Burkholderia cenocepacia TaxID=95486 RepID=UPI002231DB8E|nr:hypothetical protein [Burkholderia cenocepacia]MCW3543483.1 hypothetical protein [Burkholderia cenocepacia]